MNDLFYDTDKIKVTATYFYIVFFPYSLLYWFNKKQPQKSLSKLLFSLIVFLMMLLSVPLYVM